MHANPLSARTSAPASRVHLPSPKSSLTAAAVRPAADADFPDDYHKEWRDGDDDDDKPDPIDDDLVLWMAGICGGIMILYGLLS